MATNEGMSSYDDDLRIDIDQLDVEWLRQPRLYMKYAEMAEQADLEVKKAKEKMELEYAKSFRKILDEFDKKPSDSMIDALILSDYPEYGEAKSAYAEAIYRANVLAAVVKAMDQRKSAIEGLVKLWAGQYFSGPREPRDTSVMRELVDKRVDDIDERLRSRLKSHPDKAKKLKQKGE